MLFLKIHAEQQLHLPPRRLLVTWIEIHSG
jgi:hypothetical protein